MSSGSKSSSNSTTTNQTANIDRRLVVDNGGIGISADGSVSVNVTDGGAVKNSLDFALKALAESVGLGEKGLSVAGDGYSKLLDLSGDVLNEAFDIVKANNETVKHISQTSTEAINKANAKVLESSDVNRYLVAAGMAVVGLVAIKVWAK